MTRSDSAHKGTLMAGTHLPLLGPAIADAVFGALALSLVHRLATGCFPAALRTILVVIVTALALVIPMLLVWLLAWMLGGDSGLLRWMTGTTRVAAMQELLQGDVSLPLLWFASPLLAAAVIRWQLPVRRAMFVSSVRSCLALLFYALCCVAICSASLEIAAICFSFMPGAQARLF